jgi:biotin carboxyl carrier protein
MRLFEKYTVHLPGCDREVEVAGEAEGFMVRVPPPAGAEAAAASATETPASSAGTVDETLLTWEEAECGRVLVSLGGRPIECRVTRLPDGAFRIEWRGKQVVARVADDLAERARLAHAAHTGPMPLRCPMPGLVVKVLVEEGDVVTLEQPLLVVEAMKMHNELAAPVAGKIVNLSVKPGQAVEGDQVLLEIRA